MQVIQKAAKNTINFLGAHTREDRQEPSMTHNKEQKENEALNTHRRQSGRVETPGYQNTAKTN